MSFRMLVVLSIAAIAVAAAPALAQNQEQDVPTLTTEMVQPEPVAEPETEQAPDAAPGEEGLTPEEKADMARGDQKGETKQGDQAAAPAKKKVSPAELAWRKQYAEAEAAARDAQARADQAELDLTNLRNNLGVQSTVDERNAMAAQITQQGEVIRQARAEAAEAQAKLEEIAAAGRESNFKPDPGPARTTSQGGANPAYYQQQYNKALQAQTDAERRIQVLEDRASQARAALNLNSGSGDAFTQARYTNELNAAEAELAKAQNDLALAQAKLDAIVESARAAGINVSQP